MNCIFVDKVSNFASQELGDLLNQFYTNFMQEYGEPPEIEQQKAWESSIKYLQNTLSDSKIYDFTIAFEYRLPFSNERIDLLIFGKGKDEKPKIILFELKGWRNAKKTTSGFIVDSDIGKTVHPEYQVENYLGKIIYSHSEAENFVIVPAVLMYNADSKFIDLDFKKVDVFYKKDDKEIRDFILSHLKSPLEEDTINKFLNGEYKQSNKLFEAIKKHYKKIKAQSYLTLAENGWGLSSEQLELLEEIISDLKSGKKDIVYLIQGSPGSGKTLVAIHLLLSALSNSYQTVLAYRNNRLINSIRNIFDSIERGLSNPIKFYSVGPRANFRGVAERNFNSSGLDLVIFDEAQRMTQENIHYAVKRGRITIFFYDEGQILNAEEGGYTNNFTNEAKAQNKIIKNRYLKGFYRVEGGDQYHKFVEVLLNKPEDISKDLTITWKNNYEFKVFENIRDLISALETKRDSNGYKVALIAAFTESPGDFRDRNSIKNLRIGYPLYSGSDIYKDLDKKIYWLMDPKNDYVPFWVKGESNKLEKCASIYGCQGFETDFAGIIWGRDFIYRNGYWELGNNCQDNIGKPSLKQLIAQAKRGDNNAEKLAISLLINRYRIFLTRGIKGTYIFCEDTETAKWLKKIQDKYIS